MKAFENPQHGMSKMKEKQEKYGAWMVVNRRKPLCKANAKPLMHGGSDLAKSTQRVGAMPTPRVVDQEKQEEEKESQSPTTYGVT